MDKKTTAAETKNAIAADTPVKASDAKAAPEAAPEHKPETAKKTTTRKTTARKSAAGKAAAKTTTRKTTAKKTAAKSTTRKTTAKKTTARKTAAKKTAATKAAPAEEPKTAAAKAAPAEEPKTAAKAEAKAAPKAEAKAAAKPTAEKTAEPKAEPKAAKPVKAAPKAAAKPAAEKTAEPKEAKATAAAKPVEKAPAERPLRVLFVSPETAPFAGTGGLGDVAGSLPTALCAKGIDCRVITPLYQKVDQKWRDQMTFLGATVVPVTWRQQYMGLFELEYRGVKYYFVDNEYYFKREGLYGYYDDGERFAFFSRAVFEALNLMEFAPDIIHANDWQCALVPVYQNSIYRRDFVKTVFTIHNIEYQGFYSRDTLDSIVGLPEDQNYLLEFKEGVNFMKGAMETANAITTVSPSYAAELHDPANAFGLDGIVNRNDHKFRGIINGIDTDAYDPSKDPMIPANYSAADLSGKAECKRRLQEAAGLPQRDVPVITLVSRLVPAKGIDLICEIMDGLLAAADVQFIMLGTGYPEYEDCFRGLADRHRGKASSMIRFSTELSHLIYAGGDLLLAPSRSEPCGLTQMYGCRYGDIPVVRSTGGLRDTIKDCTLGEGNGFSFEDFSADAFYHAIMNGVERWYNKEDWKKLVEYDLGLDFTWGRSADQYIELYRSLAG